METSGNSSRRGPVRTLVHIPTPRLETDVLPSNSDSEFDERLTPIHNPPKSPIRTHSLNSLHGGIKMRKRIPLPFPMKTHCEPGPDSDQDSMRVGNVEVYKSITPQPYSLELITYRREEQRSCAASQSFMSNAPLKSSGDGVRAFVRFNKGGGKGREEGLIGWRSHYRKPGLLPKLSFRKVPTIGAGSPESLPKSHIPAHSPVLRSPTEPPKVTLSKLKQTSQDRTYQKAAPFNYIYRSKMQQDPMIRRSPLGFYEYVGLPAMTLFKKESRRKTRSHRKEASQVQF